MKELIRMVVVLTASCAISGAMLAAVYVKTAGPIAATERGVQMNAIREVLPPCNNDPVADAVTIDDPAGGRWVFYVARLDGNCVGTAFETMSMKGYSGKIRLMVGVTAADTIKAIKIVEQKETPGLGAKITAPAFRDQFTGRSAANTKWAVKKDQGDIVAITAATISSRAVTEAIKRGLDVYMANRDAITKTAQPPAGDTPQG